MTHFDALHGHFAQILARFESRPAIRGMLDTKLGIAHYAAILRQIFHQARENPQIQAYATARFRGRQRESIKRFLQHATAEIGHDRMALDDLAALGVDTRAVPDERPAPATIALTSFAYYQCSHLNPVGYLGYLFFLEFMPTTSGERYVQALARLGVPEKAMGFLLEHAKVDVHHNRLMERYVQDLVVTADDRDAVCYAMEVTGELYGVMLDGACDSVAARPPAVSRERDYTESTTRHASSA